MRQEVILHFRQVDPTLASWAQRLDAVTIEKSGDYFRDLVEAIICQQLSEKAGATIFARLVSLFPQNQVSPEAVLSVGDERIRAVGPSWSKISYIKNVARAAISGQLPLDSLDNLSDEEVIKELSKVKGIGRWTAEMFLMFSLGREDVFSYGDLGLRRAIKKLYKLKKDPTQKQLEKIVNRWRPYRTYAALILWRSLSQTK